MGTRTAAWLAWSVWALSLPFVALSGVLSFLSASARNQPDAALPLGLLKPPRQAQVAKDLWRFVGHAFEPFSLRPAAASSLRQPLARHARHDLAEAV